MNDFLWLLAFRIFWILLSLKVLLMTRQIYLDEVGNISRTHGMTYDMMQKQMAVARKELYLMIGLVAVLAEIPIYWDLGWWFALHAVLSTCLVCLMIMFMPIISELLFQSEDMIQAKDPQFKPQH